MNPTNEPWIVDDVQRVIQLKPSNFERLPDGSILIGHPESHQGQKYAPEFVYDSEEAAHAEVHNRHVRLNRSFESRDLLSVLSISKEALRKSQGFSQKDLDEQAAHDRQEYAEWKENIKRRWVEINGEEPDMARLAKDLRNAQLMKEALSCPLAHDFTEVLACEFPSRRVKTLLSERYPTGPEA